MLRWRWCASGPSYVLKNGALLFKYVCDAHKPVIAFTEDLNHMFIYTTAAFCQNMVVKGARLLPTHILPSCKVDKSPP